MRRARCSTVHSLPPRTKAEKVTGLMSQGQGTWASKCNPGGSHHYPQVLILPIFSAFKISQALLQLQPKPSHSSLSYFRASTRCCDNLSTLSTLWAYFFRACSSIRRGINPSILMLKARLSRMPSKMTQMCNYKSPQHSYEFPISKVSWSLANALKLLGDSVMSLSVFYKSKM